MKTLFAISRGAFAPESFRWIEPPQLLSINMLWEFSQTCPPGLLMRVRTEADVEQSVVEGDKIESVIGLVDSTTRWRTALAILRANLAAIRGKAMRDACWGVYGMMMQKHPAAITQPERQGAVEALVGAIESLPKELMQSAFESEIAAGLARFVMADNDVEAARVVPLQRALALGVGPKDRAAMAQRMATLDVLSSSVLLTEAHARLAERLPDWLVAPCPAFSMTAPALPTTAIREVESETDQAAGDDSDEDEED